ncbi:MAG: BamA/TamA family outer membrane protein [Myxococcota bacterium]
MPLLFATLLILAAPARADAPVQSPPAETDTSDAPPDERGLLRRYIDQLIKGPAQPEKPQFLIYPVLAYAPETRLEMGLSSLYLFRARRDPTNRLSEIPVYVFYTFNNQFGVRFENAVFTNQSRWSFLGEGQIQYFPLKYYGIGTDAESDDAVVVDARLALIRERVLVRLGESDLYFGPEIGFNAIGNVEFQPLDGPVPDPLPRGGDGTANLTVGLGLVHDTRHNPLNVREGVFGEIAYLQSSDRFLSEYTFGNAYVDLRGYLPIGEHNVLAGQVLGQFGNGDLPFNELALIGGESIMRGYYTGRYRDQNLTAAQVEFRMLPIPMSWTNRIGAAAFLAAGTVAPTISDLSLSEVRVTGGAGIRVLTFPKSDIFTRGDIGWSEDGPGFYIYVGEAF